MKFGKVNNNIKYNKMQSPDSTRSYGLENLKLSFKIM